MKDENAMNNNVDIRKIENQIQRTVVEDGLVDIMLGISLVLSGIYLINRSLVFNYFWLPFGLWIIEVARRKYIYPRVGYAKLKMPIRRVIKILVFVLVGIAITITIVTIVSLGLGNQLAGKWDDLISYTLILFTGAAFCWIAFKFQVRRWYLHGVLMAIVLFIGRETDMPGLVISLGAFVTLIGAVVFAQFLQAHPKGSAGLEEVSDAS
jgi:hypothetical protein